MGTRAWLQLSSSAKGPTTLPWWPTCGPRMGWQAGEGRHRCIAITPTNIPILLKTVVVRAVIRVPNEIVGGVLYLTVFLVVGMVVVLVLVGLWWWWW